MTKHKTYTTTQPLDPTMAAQLGLGPRPHTGVLLISAASKDEATLLAIDHGFEVLRTDLAEADGFGVAALADQLIEHRLLVHAPGSAGPVIATTATSGAPQGSVIGQLDKDPRPGIYQRRFTPAATAAEIDPDAEIEITLTVEVYRNPGFHEIPHKVNAAEWAAKTPQERHAYAEELAADEVWNYVGSGCYGPGLNDQPL